MELALKLAILFLATLTAAAPRQVIFTDTHLPNINLIYTSNHDVVDIAAPSIKLDEKIDRQILIEHETVIFFVEADLKDNGDKDYKGLYIFKDNQAKKLLGNGQSVTYAKDFNAYFGAKDGIYKYNEKNDAAEKVGNVNESVIKMATDTKRGLVYYLTEDHVVYKFGNDESTKVEAVKDARDIVFDLNGNMFFYDGTKQVYIFDGENVLKIEGLPSDKKIVFTKSPFFMQEVFAIVDSTLYKLNKDGKSETIIVTEAQPTAYALDCAMYKYFAYNEKIYRYNYTAFDKNKTDLH